MKEYTVILYNWLPNGERVVYDETSVDADTEEEALEVAQDLFLEFHPHLDADFIKANIEIIEVKEIEEE